MNVSLFRTVFMKLTEIFLIHGTGKMDTMLAVNESRKK